jgi:hypothetical protein
MAVNRHAFVQNVQAVQPLRSLQSPTFLRCDSGQAFLPREAGEDEGGGLIVLNDLNGLNAYYKKQKQN